MRAARSARTHAPVVSTVTFMSMGSAWPLASFQSSNACCFSRASARSVTMPSILLVNCVRGVARRGAAWRVVA
jgi:hypothetical protein